jgi:hypothetical protein
VTREFEVFINRDYSTGTLGLHVYAFRDDGSRALKAAPLRLAFEIPNDEGEASGLGEPTLTLPFKQAKAFFGALGNALLIQGVTTAVVEPLEREVERLEAHNRDLKTALDKAMDTIAAMGQARTRREERETEEERRHHEAQAYREIRVGPRPPFDPPLPLRQDDLRRLVEETWGAPTPLQAPVVPGGLDDPLVRR